MLAHLQTCPISFASQISFSLLVFDDAAATPVDKPFHAVFPMEVAQVRVVICDEVVKNLILYLKKYFTQYNLAGITEIFLLNISRLGSGSSPCPWKNVENPHITRTMILNKLACLPVGNRFYCIQHSIHVKTLPTCIARAKNKNK